MNPLEVSMLDMEALEARSIYRSGRVRNGIRELPLVAKENCHTLGTVIWSTEMSHFRE